MEFFIYILLPFDESFEQAASLRAAEVGYWWVGVAKLHAVVEVQIT